MFDHIPNNQQESALAKDTRMRALALANLLKPSLLHRL
jgi:hypothetical protein